MPLRSELIIEDVSDDSLKRNDARRGVSIKRTKDEKATEVRVMDKNDAVNLNLFYEGEATGTPRLALSYSYPQMVALGFAIAEFALRSWEEWNERYAAAHAVKDSPEPEQETSE